MLYYAIRSSTNDEPLALVKFNGSLIEDMRLKPFVTKGRFGPMVEVERMGRHVYNIMLGSHQEIIDEMDLLMKPEFFNKKAYRLDLITKEEWETWSILELCPTLKTAVAA